MITINAITMVWVADMSSAVSTACACSAKGIRIHLAAASSALIGLLVLIAAGHLALIGRYPRGLHDLVVGLNRWVFRVIAYTALMTDHYPPFRLDLDEADAAPSTRRPQSVTAGAEQPVPAS